VKFVHEFLTGREKVVDLICLGFINGDIDWLHGLGVFLFRGFGFFRLNDCIDYLGQNFGHGHSLGLRQCCQGNMLLLGQP